LAANSAANFGLVDSTQLGDLQIGEAHLLRAAHRGFVEVFCGTDLIGFGVDQDDLLEEPRIDLRRRVHLLEGRAGPQRELHFGQTPIARDCHLREQRRNIDLGLGLGPGEDGFALFD
jgi:hypothetical protein